MFHPFILYLINMFETKLVQNVCFRNFVLLVITVYSFTSLKSWMISSCRKWHHFGGKTAAKTSMIWLFKTCCGHLLISIKLSILHTDCFHCKINIIGSHFTRKCHFSHSISDLLQCVTTISVTILLLTFLFLFLLFLAIYKFILSHL